MRFSAFPNGHSGARGGRMVDMAWGDFVAMCRADSVCDVRENRIALAPYVLVRYPDAGAYGTRATADIEYYTGAWFDFDDVPPAVIAEVWAAVRALGCAALLHTTWSHHSKAQPRGLVRARIIIPWNGPVSPSRFRNLRLRVAAIIGANASADPATDLATNIFYACQRRSVDPMPIVLAFDGPYLDPGLLRDASEVGVDDLRDLATRIARRDAQIGRALRAIADGAPFADEGTRDATVWRVSCAIAEAFPHGDPVSIGRLFALSFAAMGCDVSKAHDKLARAYRTVATRSDETIDRLKNFWKHHGQPERTEPYNSAERDQINETYNRGDGLKWILRHPDGDAFLTIAGYTAPIQVRDSATAALVQLAPSPVRLRNASGAVRPIEDTLTEHGDHIARVNWSLYPVAAGRDYDPIAKSLTLHRTPQRLTVPLRSAIVEEYIGTMCGRSADEVFRWLSLMPDLRDPLMALYLADTAGAGKGLFAFGCASGWSDAGPVPLERVLGRWTHVVTLCPVVFGDEYFPHEHGKPKTEGFRSLVAERTHAYDAKFKDDSARILGCPRVILAANNSNLFALSANLTDNDIKAISDRVMRVHVQRESVRFLASLSEDQRREIAHEGLFRHALWLATVPRRESRFGFTPRDVSFANELAVGTGLRTVICQWLVDWIFSSGVMHRDAVCRVAGTIAVQVRSLYVAMTSSNVWGGERKARSVAELSTAVHGLSCDAEGQWVRIDPDRLRAWVALTRAVSSVDFEARLLAPLLSLVTPPAAAGGLRAVP